VFAPVVGGSCPKSCSTGVPTRREAASLDLWVALWAVPCWRVQCWGLSEQSLVLLEELSQAPGLVPQHPAAFAMLRSTLRMTCVQIARVHLADPQAKNSGVVEGLVTVLQARNQHQRQLL